MKRSGVLYILLSAFGFGLMPILALYGYRGQMGVVTMLFIRFTVAAALLLAWHRGCLRAIPAGALPGLLLLGLFYTLQSLTYFAAVTFIPVSLASLTLYSYPALVCLLSLAVDRERIRRETAAALGLSFLGLALVFGIDFKESPAPYSDILGHKNADLRPQNVYFWDGSGLISE